MAKVKAKAPSGETVKAYRFLVQGQYHAHGERGGVVRHFRDEEVILPEIVSYKNGQKWFYWMDDGTKQKKPVPNIKTEHALRCFKHVIRRIYLPLQLKEKYEDFKSIRVFDVVTRQEIQVPVDRFRDVNKTPIQDMKEHELLQFCMFNDVNVNFSIYTTLADKKIAVEMEWHQKQEQERSARKGKPKANDLLLAPPEVAVERVGDDDVIEHHVKGFADGSIEEDESVLADFE